MRKKEPCSQRRFSCLEKFFVTCLLAVPRIIVTLWSNWTKTQSEFHIIFLFWILFSFVLITHHALKGIVRFLHFYTLQSLISSFCVQLLVIRGKSGGGGEGCKGVWSFPPSDFWGFLTLVWHQSSAVTGFMLLLDMKYRKLFWNDILLKP